MEVTAQDTPLQKLIRSMFPLEQTEQSDGDLLECFVSKNDKAAFGALLLRHGPMVLGVCRRVLRNEADAEDAFQATFLVLVRKAASIRPRGMVGNWLYGVARTTALKACAMRAKRLAREREAATRLRTEQAADTEDRLLGLLDEELKVLPDKYRAAIVLCGLEGISIKEAAQRLKCPQATVGTRLARGRALLAKRLTRRGLKISCGLLTVALSKSAAPASVPPALTSVTVQTATLIAAGQNVLPGMVSVKIAALTHGVLKTMFLSKLKSTTACTLFVFAFVMGGPLYYWNQPANSKALQAAPNQERPAVKKDQKTDKERLQGEWQLAEMAFSGKELEKVKDTDAARREGRAVFDGDKMTFRGFDTTYTLDPSTKPKQMDWISVNGEGKTVNVLCIYELDGDKFKMCISIPGGDRPNEFKSIDGPPETNGGKQRVLVFKRVQVKNDK